MSEDGGTASNLVARRREAERGVECRAARWVRRRVAALEPRGDASPGTGSVTRHVAAWALAAVLGALASPAGAAVLSGVQTGTAVSTADGTVTVPITAVDTTRSFLIFETRNNSNRPVASMVRGRLASSTTLEFIRATNEGTPVPIEIQWYVAEFSSGVSVQRGDVEQTAATLNVPITAVAGVDQAFVTWSKNPAANHQNNMGTDDPVLGELTTTTNLQFRVNAAGAGIWISWQVVEFTSAADIRVQKGTTSLLTGALSVDVTLPVAVDVDTTFVLVGYRTSGGGNDIGSRMLRAQLIDATTVRIDRAIAGNNDDIDEISWQAVELRDGSEVLHGTASFASGAAQTLVGLGGKTIDPSGAVAFGSAQPVGGQNIGATPYAVDDFIGVCAVTMDLAPTFITMDRDNTASTCDVGWFVIQFAPTVTTAVELVSFVATGLDGSVELEWETASEMDNLGFHLYRSASASGPWQRITDSLIPGLGSSPVGALYGYRDTGLVNGVTYHYQLEDVETTGRTERHGPVSATPEPVATATVETEQEDPGPETGGAADPTEGAGSWIRYGDPAATSVRVVERDEQHVDLELVTGGFWALPDGDGGVWLSIPGFEEGQQPGAPALPVMRPWLEAVAGQKVKLASVVGREVVVFDGLRPAVTGEPEVWEARDGTLHAARHRGRPGKAFQASGLYPEDAAQVLGTAFQGEVKKTQLELSPLRWDRSAGHLQLARRLRVRVVFAGREEGERAFGGSRGTKERGGTEPRRSEGVVARLGVEAAGLYAVSFEETFGARGRRVSVSEISLTYQGEPVAFHVEPAGRSFGPGSVLHFVSAGADLNPYGRRAVYELAVDGGGLEMPLASAAPAGGAVPYYWQREEQEVDFNYQASLLTSPERWLWDYVISGRTNTYAFPVSALAATGEPAVLEVWLQGASDYPVDPDHHMRLSVNGSLVAEASWDGKLPYRVEAEIWPGVLREGENTLRLENVGDTGAPNSLVVLDRYAVSYPRQLVASRGALEGRFSLGGTAELVGLGSGTSIVDTTDSPERWLVGAVSTGQGLGFAAAAGRRYLAVAPEAVLRPEVSLARPSTIRDAGHRADYVVLGPRAFLEAAAPLLEHRRAQGLESLGVAIEEVYDAFGHGEPRPEAVRDFMSHAYHHWELSPRYVLLLGDATYDFKDNRGTGVQNQVPPYIIRDSFMWTVSDPAYASVNGDDLLPDLAIGRLPAQSLEEARILVDKVLAWENAGFDLSGRAVLVADNSDQAGDFEGDAERLARTVLASREVQRVYLSQLSGATRATLYEAFDGGSSLMSYVGHGAIALWASENVFNNGDVAKLAPQAQQPFLMTMNCLNGFFHYPYLNSLGEELVKAEGKGAIGAFTPSSVSVHRAARLYHEALVAEIASGRHERLGDALLAAQAAHTATGARPELLAIYQLLADPALKIR